MAKRDLDSISTIIIHCSATPPDRDVSVQDIDSWHRKRGFDEIGYHYFVDIHGSVHKGRALDRVGSHARRHNMNSIGICYAGGCDHDLLPLDTLTELQHEAITALILGLGLILQKPLSVIGHNEVSQKACPSFDVQTKFWPIQLLLEQRYC